MHNRETLGQGSITDTDNTASNRSDADPPAKAPCVFVVDNDEGVCKAIAWTIEMAGYRVRVFHSAGDFLQAYKTCEPGCLVLDVRMPGMNGLELQGTLNRCEIEIPIIFLTAHGEVSVAVEAMKHGAFDFVEKPFDTKTLLASVVRALDYDAQLRKRGSRCLELKNLFDKLTAREHEVLALVVQGSSNRAAGDTLGISYKTVEVHRTHIMRKLNADHVVDLVGLVHEAQSLGLPHCRGWESVQRTHPPKNNGGLD